MEVTPRKGPAGTAGSPERGSPVAAASGGLTVLARWTDNLAEAWGYDAPMVRRDAGDSPCKWSALACCASPAGERPVPVSAGAPGSRPQAAGETPMSERGVESLHGGSDHTGRNIK